MRAGAGVRVGREDGAGSLSVEGLSDPKAHAFWFSGYNPGVSWGIAGWAAAPLLRADPSLRFD